MEERRLVALVKTDMAMRDGEGLEDAKHRLFDDLYEGLCIPADYHIEFDIEGAEEV